MIKWYGSAYVKFSKHLFGPEVPLMMVSLDTLEKVSIQNF